MGHKAPQESQILMAGVAHEPCDLANALMFCDQGAAHVLFVPVAGSCDSYLTKADWSTKQHVVVHVTTPPLDPSNRNSTNRLYLFSRLGNGRVRKNVCKRSYACVWTIVCGLQAYVSF